MNSWWNSGLQSRFIKSFKSLPQLDWGLSVIYLRMIAFWWNKHIWIGIIPEKFFNVIYISSFAINRNAIDAYICLLYSSYTILTWKLVILNLANLTLFFWLKIVKSLRLYRYTAFIFNNFFLKKILLYWLIFKLKWYYAFFKIFYGFKF